jgi:acyl carrier protein
MIDADLKKIKYIISNHTKLDEKSIELTTSSESTDRWDSLAHINIIVDLEKHFNIKIKTSEIEKLNSVSNIIEYIKKSY